MGVRALVHAPIITILKAISVAAIHPVAEKGRIIRDSSRKNHRSPVICATNIYINFLQTRAAARTRRATVLQTRARALFGAIPRKIASVSRAPAPYKNHRRHGAIRGIACNLGFIPRRFFIPRAPVRVSPLSLCALLGDEASRDGRKRRTAPTVVSVFLRDVSPGR